MQNYFRTLQAAKFSKEEKEYASKKALISNEEIKTNDNLKKQLTYIVKESSFLQERGNRLKTNMISYKNQLELFYKDYQTSKEQGFFVTNSKLHSKKIAELKRQIQKINKIEKDIILLGDNLAATGLAYKNLAMEEINRINQNLKTSSKVLINLEKQQSQIYYPILSKSLGIKIKNVLNTDFSN